MLGHRVSVRRPLRRRPQDFPQIPEGFPQTPRGAAPVTVMEQGGREEGRRLAGGLFLCCTQERPGRTTVRIRPGRLIVEVSRHRVLSSATAPCSTLLNHKGSWISYSSAGPSGEAELRRVFLHQSTARRFTTLRPAPPKNNDGYGREYSTDRAWRVYNALHCRMVLDFGTAALTRLVSLGA